MALLMAKILSLIMITVGLGGIDTHNHNYLETATVVAVMVQFYLDVIFLPRIWPRQPAMTTELPAVAPKTTRRI